MSNKILAKDVQQGQLFTYQLNNNWFTCYRIQEKTRGNCVASIDIDQSIPIHYTKPNQEVYV